MSPVLHIWCSSLLGLPYYGVLVVGTLLVLSTLTVSGCLREKTDEQTATIDIVSVEVTVRQRSTTAIEDFKDRLSLTVDAITHNLVQVCLTGADGTAVLSTRSMSPRDEVTFEFEGTHYVLTLQRLDNALIGEDFATFVIRNAAERDENMSEQARIEQLIQAVADLHGATFIRNGVEYGAQEAADHMRMKWRFSGDRISTADQFIEALASHSSVTGQPYWIRLPDGREVQSGE